jgi:selenocysteine lyase/cysteine desulfurase
VNIEDPSNWCGLVNFYIDGVDVGKFVDYLLSKHRIYVVPIVHPEFKGIRVTPNVYTLTSEMELFADIIVSVAKGEIKEVMG